MADAPAIETVALSKTYPGGVRALSELDLRVERGEVFGFLGPERRRQEHDDPAAARPDPADRGQGARARARQPPRRRRGAPARRLPPGRPAPADRLTGREQLDSLARLRATVDPALRDALVERFGVVLDRPIRELSKGNRQKLGLVQAFMHRPELLVLDEPTERPRPAAAARVPAARARDRRRRAAPSSSRRTRSTRCSTSADRVGIIRGGRLVDVDTRRLAARAGAPPRDDRLRERGRSRAVRSPRRASGSSTSTARPTARRARARRWTASSRPPPAHRHRRPPLRAGRPRGDLPRPLPGGRRWP